MTEQEKYNFVSGKFLTCMLDFDILKTGEKYWLEYIGYDTYIGRSDNILNKRVYIEPHQLELFIEEKTGHEVNNIKWLNDWFYGVRTWGLLQGETNEELTMRCAIKAFNEYQDMLNTPGC